jgi:hypothetical protein
MTSIDPSKYQLSDKTGKLTAHGKFYSSFHSIPYSVFFYYTTMGREFISHPTGGKTEMLNCMLRKRQQAKNHFVSLSSYLMFEDIISFVQPNGWFFSFTYIYFARYRNR